MRAGDVPIVFLSYDEPWADAFWEDLLQKAPHAKRVHGVKGLDACHKAAAREADGPRFVTVDADTLVDAGFFDLEVPNEFLNDRCHVEWPSRNVVNGLIYGNGSLKCWSRRMVANMRSHEAAPRGVRSLDHDTGKNPLGGLSGPRKVILPEVASETYPAETPYHGFRCGFREGVRLSLLPAHRPGRKAFGDSIDPWSAHRLKAWCCLGTHAPFGLWMIYGARLGLWMAQRTEWDVVAINDYGWFDRFWDDMIVARFSPGGSRCRYSGFTWDNARLADEVAALGARISDELNFELVDLSGETSSFFTSDSDESIAYSMVDSIGHMYLKGHGVEQDFAKAREMFEIGAILGTSGAVNNIARMYHLGMGVAPDPATAIRYYEDAIAMQNAFAPYHLATLLGEIDPDAPETADRRRALVRLSADRGYAPDGKAGS